MKKLMILCALAAALRRRLRWPRKPGPPPTIGSTSAARASRLGANATANRNTGTATIEKTIAAHPGLAEKLAAEGVDAGTIGNLSVEPDGKVIVCKR